MTADRVPIREDLADVAPYGAPQLDVPVRLNNNETPHPPPPEFDAALSAAVAGLELNRYPDRRAVALRQRVAEREGLSADRVWAANGSNEVLLQLFLAYGGAGRRMLLFRPGYSAHPLIARVSATATVEHDLPDDFRLTPDVASAAMAIRPDLVVVAHPNNPTGLPVPMESVRVLHDEGAGLVVVDEAYVEFGEASARALLDELPRLVVTRTFSKALRLAGLRLGYLLAHDWVIDDLRRVRLPYHLDALKLAAAEVAFDLHDRLSDHIPAVVGERERVRASLGALPGVDVFPSSANFLLFRTAVPDLFDRLLARGVLVRDFSHSPRLEGCLRVTIGTPDENDAFLEALRHTLGEVAA